MLPSSTSGIQPRSVSTLTVVARVGLLVAWMTAIFVFSAQSGAESEVSSDALADFVRSLGLSLPVDTLTFLIRKAAHAFAYLGLGILAFRVAVLTPLSLRQAAVYSLVFVLAYAASDELHQLVVPGRSGEVRDVMIDTTAGAIGILVSYLVYRSLPRRHSK